MEQQSLFSLSALAAFLGVVHTIAGPDHYVPFLAMSRAGNWTVRRTLFITLLCGIGHVLGSVLLGTLGIALGWALGGLERWESIRGEVAAWLLIGFGIAYTAWGLRRAHRNIPHTHVHVHADGTVHRHEHVHHAEHAHVHEGAESRNHALTPWILFTIFVFGPCEPLIPLLMVPAAARSAWSIAAVATIFAAATVLTMILVVSAGLLGMTRLKWRFLERYSDASAGAALFACGLAIKFGL